MIYLGHPTGSVAGTGRSDAGQAKNNRTLYQIRADDTPLEVTLGAASAAPRAVRLRCVGRPFGSPAMGANDSLSVGRVSVNHVDTSFRLRFWFRKRVRPGCNHVDAGGDHSEQLLPAF